MLIKYHFIKDCDSYLFWNKEYIKITVHFIFILALNKYFIFGDKLFNKCLIKYIRINFDIIWN